MQACEEYLNILPPTMTDAKGGWPHQRRQGGRSILKSESSMQAAAALAVGVGSFSDPADLQVNA